ncbi:hypothetical protein [Actinomadura flavalba]|uniref:hypothetical protein n=1 Tax=Actinomadura flavalba TaxID=1120938 RepID=UPI00036E0FEA|nr:hypothetical protein [Actinomadura flavalba]
MKFRKTALAAATAATALLPVAATITPAHAAERPAALAAEPSLPGQEELIKLVLAAFPANIQADVQKLLAGDYSALSSLLTNVLALTPAQLQAISAKLLDLLKLLPIQLPQQNALRAQLDDGLTQPQALFVALAPTALGTR